MDDCKIVTDLLPSYCDELTSWETNTYIRNHLNTCPGCKRLLEQMQARKEPNEADIRRADFKAALEIYERNHRVRMCIIALVCLVLVTAFFVVRACSFDIAIAAEGLDSRYLQVVQEPIPDYEGKLFQIVSSRTEDGYAALAYLSKNFLGFWTVSGVDVATPDREYGNASMGWFETLASDYDGPGMTPVSHEIYSGLNAIDSLEKLPQDQIPGNVAVLIEQNYAAYSIHVITVLPEGGSAFYIMPVLQENGLIS